MRSYCGALIARKLFAELHFFPVCLFWFGFNLSNLVTSISVNELNLVKYDKGLNNVCRRELIKLNATV